MNYIHKIIDFFISVDRLLIIFVSIGFFVYAIIKINNVELGSGIFWLLVLLAIYGIRISYIVVKNTNKG